MNLEIASVHNHGSYEKEYVSLKVKEDCDAGQFLLADTTYRKDNKVSSKIRHFFWMPDKQVKKGDYIFVHTNRGTNSEIKNNVGTKTHHFYWGLEVSVWNDDGDCAILFHCDVWCHSKTK